ncbi:hypothetical protein ACO0LV_09315 [Pseudactinotalea sp. Z1739]|uniref:hypothetical protein n=1 Tax=Pseudactinotalea sp. Z1739 TaxID=3413028 RepID=UPI003C7D4FDB
MPDSDRAEQPPGSAGASPSQPSEREARTAATHAARALALAVRVLRWPSLLLALIPVVPLAGLVWVMAGLRRPVGLIVVGVLIAIGLTIEVAFVLRRRAYLRAAAQPEQLADEFRALLRPGLLSKDLLEKVRDIAARGGLLLLRRLRSLWVLVRLPDQVIGILDDYPRARLFIPPTLGTSGLRVLAQAYLSALSWLALILVLALRAAGYLT